MRERKWLREGKLVATLEATPALGERPASLSQDRHLFVGLFAPAGREIVARYETKGRVVYKLGAVVFGGAAGCSPTGPSGRWKWPTVVLISAPRYVIVADGRDGGEELANWNEPARRRESAWLPSRQATGDRLPRTGAVAKVEAGAWWVDTCRATGV